MPSGLCAAGRVQKSYNSDNKLNLGLWCCTSDDDIQTSILDTPSLVTMICKGVTSAWAITSGLLLAALVTFREVVSRSIIVPFSAAVSAGLGNAAGNDLIS